MGSFTKQVVEIIPADTIVEAELINAEERETPFWVDDKDHSKGKSQQVSYTFKVVDGGEYNDKLIFGNTSTYYSDTSKFGSWVRELLAMDELPDEFDLEALIGARVKVIVGNRQKEINGEMVTSGHFAETIARLADDDYIAADDAF